MVCASPSRRATLAAAVVVLGGSASASAEYSLRSTKQISDRLEASTQAWMKTWSSREPDVVAKRLANVADDWRLSAYLSTQCAEHPERVHGDTVARCRRLPANFRSACAAIGKDFVDMNEGDVGQFHTFIGAVCADNAISSDAARANTCRAFGNGILAVMADADYAGACSAMWSHLVAHARSQEPTTNAPHHAAGTHLLRKHAHVRKAKHHHAKAALAARSKPTIKKASLPVANMSQPQPGNKSATIASTSVAPKTLSLSAKAAQKSQQAVVMKPPLSTRPPHENVHFVNEEVHQTVPQTVEETSQEDTPDQGSDEAEIQPATEGSREADRQRHLQQEADEEPDVSDSD